MGKLVSGERFYQKIFDNGLCLLAESMPWLESAAFGLLVPSGYQFDPPSRLGLANLTCEMIQRGAGSRDSRQFLEDLERLGIESSGSASNSHIAFGGAMTKEVIHEALSIYADVIRRPHLPAEQLDDGKKVCVQELFALQDDPSQLAMLALRKRHWPDPFGRSVFGTEDSIESISQEDLAGFFESTFRPNGAILSVAGNVDWDQLVRTVERVLGDWQAKPDPAITVVPAERGSQHIEYDSSQTQIVCATPSVPYSHVDYFKSRGVVGVLSDGMSSRLFNEIREKRGLCYTVYASNYSLKNVGSIMAYAGTSSERAQETLDVLKAELARVSDGIAPDELSRLKTQIKSSLIMQQESSRARAGALAGDYYHFGRIRPLSEIMDQVDSLTVPMLNEYAAANPLTDLDIVTLGKEALEF